MKCPNKIRKKHFVFQIETSIDLIKVSNIISMGMKIKIIQISTYTFSLPIQSAQKYILEYTRTYVHNTYII